MNKRVIQYVRAVAAFFILVPVCLIGFSMWCFIDSGISYAHLEKNVQAHVSGTELQHWATNLLAQYPDGTHLTPAKLGTNFPPQLLGLWHWHKDFPDIYVHGTQTNYAGQTVPGWLQLVWGAGGTGHSGFDIGPTNFTDITGRGRRWQDGVYFSPNR